MPFINVNTDALVDYTRKLEQLNRTAFPYAVQNTLNDAAFDMKRNTLPASARQHFITRSATFFKAFSGVQKATGKNVNRMQARVGMSDNGKQSARSAVRNLALQEAGGVIRSGASYLSATRSGNNAKRVTRSNYFEKSRVLGGPFKKNFKSSSARFVASAYAALKTGKRMYINTESGRYLMAVTSIKRLRNEQIKVHSKLLMEDRSDHPANIKPTHFVRDAAAATSRKIPGFYVKQAERQFNRVLR